MDLAPPRCPCCSSPIVRQCGWRFRCGSCGFLASNLKPGSGLGIGGLEQLRRLNFRRMCDRLSRLRDLRGCSLLEVGCAEGWFLEEARARGIACRAVEPSEAHAKVARSKRFEVDVGFFPDEPSDGATFDIIVFNDVFEHIPAPEQVIAACERLLRPGGLLVINLPSSAGAMYRAASALNAVGLPSLLDRLWQRGFPSPHISYFNPRNLALLAQRNTSLEEVDRFSLHTMVTAGLLDRIRSSHPGPVGWLLWPCLALSIPLLRLLPPDIVASVFRKGAGAR